MIKTTESGSVIASKSEGGEPTNAKFINYKNNYVSINTWRNPEAEICHLSEILEAIENDSSENLTISIEGVVDALQDGEYLGTVKASQDTIEKLFNAICEQA